MAYYDGTKLMSLNDIDGQKPELYICTTNRTGGKTTFFSRYCTKRFVNNGEKFALFYRFANEMGNVADQFFKDIGSLFFPDYDMTQSIEENGKYIALYLNGINCGYALPLNLADQLKRYSHYFSDVQRVFFDEFQSETNHYCTDEVEKFLSLHTTIARGQGKQRRYVPCYLTGNPVTLLNPYYTALGISSRLNTNVKFLKGHGFVMEQGYVDSASRAIKESGITKAFAQNQYTDYQAEGIYLNDSLAFIEQLEGKNEYYMTLRYKGNNYAIRIYQQLGLVYCSDKADMTYPLRIAVTTEDHNVNYVTLKSNTLFLKRLRYFFDKGCFRFKNLQCKEAIMSALSY